MNNATQKTQNSNKFNSLQNEALRIQIKENEVKLDLQLGLNPPKNATLVMLEIWNDFFILIREMYAWKILEANFVRKYCFDFFEMGRKKPDGSLNNENQEIIIKKTALQNMWASVMKKIEIIKELQGMEHEDKMKQINIDIFDSLQTDNQKIEFLTYLNNGEIPEEVQALIDERAAENSEENQLSTEEIDELQRNEIRNIFGKYNNSSGKLNLGKAGNVVSAEAIDEFINQQETKEAQNLRSQTKIRTLPNLPNQDSISSSNDQQNNQNLPISNSNFTPNFENQTNQPKPPNNSQTNSNSGQFGQTNLVQNNNQNSVSRNNIPNSGQNNSNNSSNPNFLPNPANNNLHNPKAIPPRSRSLDDLLKK